MQTLAKFQVEKTIFGAGVRQLLISHAGVDAAAISEGDTFAVWPTSSASSEPFEGIAPLLAVASSSPQAKSTNLIPTQPSELRAATMQWCTLAAQLASNKISFADVESRVNIAPGIPSPKKSFVTGTEKPSAADFLLLSSLKGSLKQCRLEAPNVYKWAEAVLKQNETCQQFCSLNETSSASNDQQQDGAAAASTTTGKQEFAIPNAAEIAARRAAKEQAKKEKAEKDAAAAATKDAAAASSSSAKQQQQQEQQDLLSPDQGLDLRVGRITDVAAHPTADRLYVETIDLAEPSGPRTIISGLVNFYKPEELKDQLVIVVCNMKPKKLVGTDSHGMVLCASTPESVKIIQPPATAKPGDCVTFGKNVAAAVANKAIPSSTKMGQLLEHLRTDENGICLWKDVPLTIGGEHPITAPLKNVPVK